MTEHTSISGGGRVDAWPTLLVVDNDPHMLQTLVCYFEKRGFRVASAASVTEAKTLFQQRKLWTLVLSDYHLPDGTGGDLFNWIRAQPGTPPPLLLMSGSIHGGELCAGIDFLAKPFPIGELEARVQLLLRSSTT